MNSTKWIAAIVASGALVGAGIAAGSYISTSKQAPYKPAFSMAPMTQTGNPANDAITNLRSLDSTFTSLAEGAAESVVVIQPAGQNKMGGGSGSGFVYRSDGWIITNDHVTGGSDKVTVVLHDGKEYEGTVYSAKDRQLDVAVVKINANGLTPLDMADSDQVKAGQFAVAVGAPFGYESTVTVGHISATNRPGQAYDMLSRRARVYTGMIQTDAAINPGNSGGPLLNIDGQVVGVNSTISTTTGGSNGIGFAMPSNAVKVVADELIANKKFDRGFLGISFQEDIKPYKLKELGLTGGAMVVDAPENGPAYKAGLRDSDIITKVDNSSIRNQSDLLLSMYRHSPGDTVQVSVKRGSEDKSFRVKLTDAVTAEKALPEAPEQPSPENGGGMRGGIPDDLLKQFGSPDFFKNFRSPDQGAPRADRSGGERPKLGMDIETPSATLRSQFNVPQDVKGVVVTRVAGNSLASRYGIQEGDVILEVNGKAVASPQELVAEIAKVNVGDDLRIKFASYSKSGKMERDITIPFE